jgi:aldehyde:ferredoxin oxidoreductase
MDRRMYGWKGKILKVNLSDGSTTRLSTESYGELFLGGKGFCTKIAWDELSSGIGPFDPENLIVFMTGPLTGTAAPTSGSGIASAISPRVYPKPWYTRSHIGGFWAPELKYAGFDGLILIGKASRPVYLWIFDGAVEIREARDLWGRGCFETQKRLKAIHGPRAQVLCIGPAGENLVRFSTIQHNLSNASGQTGFGAVLGSKLVKAIAIRGTQGVRVADPEGFLRSCQEIQELVKNGPNFLHMVRPSKEMEDRHICTASCPCICTTRTRRNVASPSGEGRVTVMGHCLTEAVNKGWSRTEYHGDESGKFRTASTPGFERGAEIQYLMEDLGLSAWEYFNFYPWFEILRRNGVTRLKELELDIELADFWLDFLRRIAYRQGVGDILAESLIRVSERLDLLDIPGELWPQLTDAAHFLQPAYGFPSHRLGRAAESQPSPLWLFSMLHWAFDTRDPMASHHQSSFLEYILPPHHGVPEPKANVPMEKIRRAYEKMFANAAIISPGFEPVEDKVRYAIWHQNRSCIKDSLLLCDFVFPKTFASFANQAELDRADDISGDLDAECKLLSPLIGKQVSSADLDFIGERIFNLERMLHVRNFQRNRSVDETIKWVCELPEKSDGTRIDGRVFARYLDSYYTQRGWNRKTGSPGKKKLLQLGLEYFDPLCKPTQG